MNLFDASILGVVQGLTEFLPISSSGHLIIAESLMKLPVEDLKGFDIAIHVGTLLAILIYFRKDFLALIKTLWLIVAGKSGETDRKNVDLIMYLVVAMVPAVAVGLLFNDYLDENFRNAKSVAAMLIVVAVYFVIAEYFGGRRNAARAGKPRELGWPQVIMIGLAQAVALIPGVSRSGATISTGLITGLKREEAARFSFLLGAVAIAAASTLSVYKFTKGEFALPDTGILFTGIVSSFVSGYAAIAFLMSFLKKHSLYVFAAYRILLGAVMLFLL